MNQFSPPDSDPSAPSLLTERDPSSITWASAATVVGSPKNIPYAVNTIRQAYNEVYGTNLTTLQPNYLYVRFLPQDAEDVGLLSKTELEFWDFPLHRELISLGEKYHDPAVSSPDYTWQYAVVPADFEFPAVQYEIIEPLALVPEDCKVAQAAFEISQNEYDAPDEFEEDPAIKDGKVDYVLPKDDKIPGGDTPEAPGPGPTLLNPAACGCALPDDVRKPSGCVTVEDNNLGIYDPVREVRVSVSRSRLFGFIFHRSAYTNEYGCWQIDHKYSGKIHVWVKFESATCNIKTMETFHDLWSYTFPRKAYIGKFGGPNFNNISIQFDHTNIINSKEFRSWVASTINNSIYEAQRYFAFNGLPSPPGNLKILVTPWGDDNTGAAPMLDKSPANSFILGSSTAGLLGGAFGVIGNPPISLLAIALVSWVTVAAPDIVFNINNAGNINADDIRETSYHELSHAIHFLQAGDQYWYDEIAYTINHLGYGNGNAPGSGRVEVVESWGFMMGFAMSHLRYGINHSNGFLGTWEARLERVRFWDPINTFIPFGWHYDLLDDNATNTPFVTEPSSNNTLLITDNIAGFTLLEIYNTLTNNMLSIQQQKSALQPLLPSKGQTLSDYNTLSSGYGF